MAPSLLLTKMPMTPLRVMGMVVGVAVICLFLSAFRVPSKSLKLGTSLDQPPAAAAAAAAAALHVKRDTSGRTMADPSFWHTFDFQSESIPPAVVDAASKVTVITNNINIMGANTFYREAKPPAEVEPSGEVVLLLHGAAFKSAKWVELNTINLLAGMGHRVIAVDLPGFGNSGRQELGAELRRTWLQSFLIALNLPPCVVVSPSFSGVFSLPMLVLQPHEFDGFVPIAVDATDEIPVHRLQAIRVPTLIIYGEKDTGLGHLSRDDLSNIPTSQAVELPGARHPAYLDQTNIFHTLLYNFIKQVHAHRAVV